MKRRALAAFALVLAHAGAASATEPWSDADPVGAPARLQLGSSIGFRGAAEYRANLTAISNLDSSPTIPTGADKNYAVVEHRLRLDAGLDWQDKVRIMTSVDALDGVLWGDNGTVNDSVQTSGSNVATINPNVAGPCVALRPNAQPTAAASYRYGLCSADPLFVRRLYGDVVTPIGVFRIGRQPYLEGASIEVNDGDGRKNRFGFARRGNSVDRAMFVTKPVEFFKPADERDLDENRGGFLILAFDRLAGGDPMTFKDDLSEWVTAARWLEPTHRLGGDFEAQLYHRYRWSSANDTGVSALGGRLMSRLGSDFHAGIEMTFNTGSTREISNALSVSTKETPSLQDVRSFGARGVVSWDQRLFSLYLEGDYASGDGDPSTKTPLTQFRFADDAHVGLLLFDHVLAYQSARAAAADIATLKGLNAPSLPADQIATGGSFTNAAAIFPQVDVHPLDDFLIRGGVLFAAAPARMVDPLSLQHLVNFEGGKPGRYYGTEFDLRLQYRLYDHFVADVEGAYLVAGSALQDINHYASNSALFQARTTFYF